MYQRTMIKMHAKFTWLKECKQVFITINKELCNAPVMAYFNPNRETKLILDRSTKTGFSSILTQLDPEMQQHQAVYYENRSTKLQEQRYSQIEIESAAIEFGVSNSHIYLCGILEFTIIRDQRPFLRIYSTFRRKPPPRILKYNLRNQGYNFTLQYEPRGAKIWQITLAENLADTPETCLEQETEKFIEAIVQTCLLTSLSIK